MKHIQRQQFSFTKTSTKSVAENPCLCFSFCKPASWCFFKDELEARKSLKASFTAGIITKNSLERVLSICGEKKRSVSLYKRDTRSDHCLKSYKRA